MLKPNPLPQVILSDVFESFRYEIRMTVAGRLIFYLATSDASSSLLEVGRDDFLAVLTALRASNDDDLRLVINDRLVDISESVDATRGTRD